MQRVGVSGRASGMTGGLPAGRYGAGLGEPGQPLGYLGVAAPGDVLIAQRHLWGGVPEPVHEFCRGRARLGGEHRADVAQVVDPEVGLADGYA